MLKSFKILISRSNNLRTIQKFNNNNFQVRCHFKFSSAQKKDNHQHTNDHEEHHEDHHHGEPKDYHNLKFDRVSYNQKLTKEQRKP